MSRNKKAKAALRKKKGFVFKNPEALKKQGIIPELGLSEERRDQLAKRDWSKPPTKTLKQQNPDNLTSKELKEIRFSGFRWNTFAGLLELWVLGDVMSTASASEVRAKGPALLSTMHEAVFATKGTFAEVPEEDAQLVEIIERYQQKDLH